MSRNRDVLYRAARAASSVAAPARPTGSEGTHDDGSRSSRRRHLPRSASTTRFLIESGLPSADSLWRPHGTNCNCVVRDPGVPSRVYFYSHVHGSSSCPASAPLSSDTAPEPTASRKKQSKKRPGVDRCTNDSLPVANTSWAAEAMAAIAAGSALLSSDPGVTKPQLISPDTAAAEAAARRIRRPRVAIVLYGVLARSLRMAWPHIRQAIVAPLETAGCTTELLGVDIDVGDAVVDGVKLGGRALFTPHAEGGRGRSSGRAGHAVAAPPLVPLAHLLSMPQAKVDERLSRLCGASAPGCVPSNHTPPPTNAAAAATAATSSMSYGRYIPTGAARTVRCPPLVSDLVYPTRREEMARLYASDASAALRAGARLMRPYHEAAMVNAYRQLHTEWRVGQYLHARAHRYDAAVALTADAVPLMNLSARDVLAAAEHGRALLTSDQNDRQGYTNGLVAGHPLTMARVLRRLYDLAHGRMPAVAEVPTDYEGIFKASFDLHALERRVTCMRFAKVRANGKLAYTKCLGDRWVRECSAPDQPLRPLTELPHCPEGRPRRLSTAGGPAQPKRLQPKGTKPKPARQQDAHRASSPLASNTFERHLVELRAQASCPPRAKA